MSYPKRVRRFKLHKVKITEAICPYFDDGFYYFEIEAETPWGYLKIEDRTRTLESANERFYKMQMVLHRVKKEKHLNNITENVLFYNIDAAKTREL